jgi:hypothetical protein
MLAGKHGSEYRETMGILSQPDLSRILYTFCTAPASALECSFLDINGSLVLCVHGLQIPKLVK